MNITYLGHSCFRLRGKQKTVICDPYQKSIGFTLPKSKADIVTLSHKDSTSFDIGRVEGNPFVVKGPGEYEIGGVSIYGLQVKPDEKSKQKKPSIVYVINIDRYRVCYLGDLKHSLSEKQLEEIDGVDVLLVPVGEKDSFDTGKVVSLIEKIEPKVVIPMFYKTKNHVAAFSARASLEDFIKAWGREANNQEKLNLKKFTLTEDIQLVVLEQKG